MSKVAIAGMAMLVALGSWYGLHGQSTVATPTTKPAPAPAFTGRVLMLTLQSDPDYTVCIENPVMRRLGGRNFIVGTCIDTSAEDHDWRAGLLIWTAMDDISQLVEARDAAELREKLEETTEAEDKPTRA